LGITFDDLIFNGDVITVENVDGFSISLNGLAANTLTADDFVF
jgi:hypothetical protein